MTDENKEVTQEQEQPRLELTDAPAQDQEAAVEEMEQAPEVIEVAFSTAQEPGAPADREEDPAPEVAILPDTEQDAAQEESEPVRKEERAADQSADAPQEGDAPEEAQPPLTQGERDIDQVIGVLLGESQEGEPEPDSHDDDVEERPPEDQLQVEDAAAQETEGTGPEPGTAGEAGPVEVSPPSEQESEPAEQTPTIESVLEAILFATDEPLTDGKLAGIIETTAKQVRDGIESLNARYAAGNHAFRIEQIAGGYQMLTLNAYNPWLKKMLRVRSDNKLSPAALETLAIIAYKQPIIRADIEAIRGVAVGEVIRSLMYKGLVKIAGRAEILGRPMLYGTTKKFLEIFGLNSLKDLPKAEELKNPDRG